MVLLLQLNLNELHKVLLRRNNVKKIYHHEQNSEDRILKLFKKDGLVKEALTNNTNFDL